MSQGAAPHSQQPHTQQPQPQDSLQFNSQLPPQEHQQQQWQQQSSPLVVMPSGTTNAAFDTSATSFGGLLSLSKITPRSWLTTILRLWDQCWLHSSNNPRPPLAFQTTIIGYLKLFWNGLSKIGLLLLALILMIHSFPSSWLLPSFHSGSILSLSIIF